ncbi:MAG TPA: choice-of-anchor J domain-containing protein [Dokdonella sp.]|uniref:choice-of-anchor J domain-containing protein n=1 Tax=Dokdonella sp. TaxID=2291710 RepID=UPI002B605815|nr:choice-of-anchor J domain-containing protein [Dokdonella sp.]HUD40786.1 choice-of-anchor J domain-containing protein [Dokdonella sp.]
MFSILLRLAVCLLAIATLPALGQAVPAAATIDEGFERVDIPNAGLYHEGWTRIDTSEMPLRDPARGHGWHPPQFGGFTAYDAPAGSMIQPMSPSEVPVAGVVSTWLISPPIAFGPAFALRFRTRSFGADVPGDGGVDRLQVRLCAARDCADVGSTAEEVGDFQQLLLDINAAESETGFPTEWTQYLVGGDGLVPTEGVGRIAFRYYVHQDALRRAAGKMGLDRVTVATAPAEGQGIALGLYASPYDPAAPQACSGTDALSVARGDRVNLCYAVTNTSTGTLRYHWLRDDDRGPLLARETGDLAPGETRRFNRVFKAVQSGPIAATSTSTPDAPDYRLDDGQPAAYVDIHQTGTPIAAGTVDTMPFPFEFYGKPVERFCVRDDATFVVVNESACPQQTVGEIPTESGEYVVNSPFAAVYAERFWPNVGRTYREVLGTAPNRRLVIQWYQKVPITVPPAAIDPSRGLDAAIVLHEGSNRIEFLYRNTQFGAAQSQNDGGNASIGIQKDLTGVRYAYREPALTSVRRIVWTPVRPDFHVDSRIATIEVRNPAIDADTSALWVAAPSQGAATRTLRIANAGPGRLDWSSATSAAPAGAGTGDMAFYTFDLWNSFVGTGYGQLIRFSPGQTNYQQPGGATVVANLDGRLILATAFIDDDFSTLYGIDADTRELLRWRHVDQPYPAADYEVVGVVPLLLDPITGLREDPATGAVYLTTSDGSSSALWRIDPETATVDPVGVIAGAAAVDDIAFDGDGRLYGIDEALDALLEIDTASAQSRVIGALGIDAANSSALAFDPGTDTLYLITFDRLGTALGNQLFTVDRSTGRAAARSEIIGIEPALPIALWETLAVAHRTSACTAPSSVPWLTVTPAQGSIEPAAAGQDVTLTFDGAALPDGIYRANLCLRSNDPLRPRMAVPLHFLLGTDVLFKTGFEP